LRTEWRTELSRRWLGRSSAGVVGSGFISRSDDVPDPICAAHSFQATGVSHSGVSRSAISRRNPGASTIRSSCPQVLTSSDYAPSQLSGLPMLPPLSAVSSPCQLVNLSTGQLVIRSDQPSLWASRPLTCIAVSLVNVSTCPRAPSRLRRAHFCTRHRRICTFALHIPYPYPHLITRT
jgi:hypothetical protein